MNISLLTSTDMTEQIGLQSVLNPRSIIPCLDTMIVFIRIYFYFITRLCSFLVGFKDFVYYHLSLYHHWFCIQKLYFILKFNRRTQCKYFKRGDGNCPFGNKCFYLHQYKDGRLADLPDPTKRRRFNRFGNMEAYSNLVRIDFDYSDDEDEVNELDIIEFLRHHFMLGGETDDESDLSDLFELSSEFSNFF